MGFTANEVWGTTPPGVQIPPSPRCDESRHPSRMSRVIVNTPVFGPGCFSLSGFSGLVVLGGVDGRVLDLKAVQELLAHEWPSTTTRYIHVHADHVDHAWAAANERVAARLTGE
jgi:hypothetical protein